MGRTIVEAFRQRVRLLADRPALRRRRGEDWETLTWADYGRSVAEVLAGLDGRGIGPGDGVAVLSANRVEWHLVDHAVLALGAVTVPIYQTNSAEQVAYILGDADVRVCFVENAEQLAKVLSVRDQVPKLDFVVVFEPDHEAINDSFVTGFDGLCAAGRDRLARDPSVFDRRAEAVAPEQLATLVYTSGTTGPPKGTMISHANIMWTIRNATEPFEVRADERLLSFLPLSHIAERMMSDFLPVAVGGETWFARGFATVAEDLRACRPTVFFAVPRVWEKLQEAVLAKLAEAPAVQRRVVGLYLSVGRRVVDRQQAGSGPDPLTALTYRGLDRVIGAKIRHELGLDRAHVLITAAAPIHPDLIRWFHALGLPVLELYGQTEDCGPTTSNRPDKNKIGTVGPPIPGVSLRFAENGEILVKGGNVCMGYYKNPAGTAELIDSDGWMHTGDLGEIDQDGFLRITGRVKDLIITAAGKNIAPQEIEVDLRYHPLISQAVVIGEGRRYLTALITLDSEELAKWAETRGRLGETEALRNDAEVVGAVKAAIDEVNAKRSRVESIRKFRILPHDFTVAEGELTPTLKVKRNVVNDKYRSLIEEMYQEKE